jgi:spermidine/putrescine transport system substrate-binding protein
MFRASEDARAAHRPFTVGFSTPKEGAVLAVDNMVLHVSGRRTDLALQFINFMLEGENSATLSNAIGAGNPNADALRLIAPEIARNPDIFPDTERLKRLEMIRDFDPRERRILSRMWTEIKVR